MFGNKARRAAFDREVRLEMEILRKLHGDDAHRVAVEKAGRPTNRTARRKVLEEAARQLALQGDQPGGSPERKSVFGRIFGS